MIYALLDTEALKNHGLDLSRAASYLQRSNITIAQYRNKTNDLSQMKSDLELIRKQYQGTLIINDRIELIDWADGLHLGQDDLAAIGSDSKRAVETIRKQIGRKLLGLSTHNLDEIREANELDLDYIGLGAYRSTSTKKDAEILGSELLEIAKISQHPIAIIGGVRLDDHFDPPIKFRAIASDLYKNMLNS